MHSSDEDTAGASPPDPSATFAGGGAFHADATVMRPSEPDAGTRPRAPTSGPPPIGLRCVIGRLIVLPEPPEPEDREFALDTYQELITKAQELHERLKGTNSARRICKSFERLLTALGTSFDDLRPGVLLSPPGAIVADRAAFGGELFPDTIAMMDDTLQTLRDLLAAFPIVRRIEAEGLALHLDRSADAIPTIWGQMDAIKAAAVQSGAAPKRPWAPSRKTTLLSKRRPIRWCGPGSSPIACWSSATSWVQSSAGSRAMGPLLTAKARAGMGELAGKSWEEVKNQLPKSIERLGAAGARSLVGLAVGSLTP